MKALQRTFFLSFIFLFGVQGHAQVDRSNPPEPGPPPEIKLEDPYSFQLENGLKVYVVEDHSLPVLSFYLRPDHDPILEGKKKGYVGMAGSMLDRGTENRDRKEIAEEVDGMGASLRTSSSYVYASSLRKHSQKLLDIMADVVKNPTFPEEELKKLKRRKKSSIQQEQSQPSAIRSNVRKAVSYGKDHPYGEIETKESIERVQASDCRSYYEDHWNAGNSYMAVVGDIDPEKAEELVRSHFEDWGGGEAPSHEYEQPQAPEENKVALADKDGAVQSSLSLCYPVKLEPGDEDVLSVKLMNSILGGGGFSSRLLKNIREDKGYTYGVFSNVGTDELVSSFRAGGSVATAVTDSALTQFFKEIEKMKKGGVTKEELEDHRDRMAGGFTLGLENSQTIARYAINIDRYDLPEDYYKNYLKRLDKVSKEEVDRAAQDYLKPDSSHIVVVGDEDSLLGRLDKFGPVQRYDKYGFEKGEKKEVNLPDDLTPKKVMEDYEKAVGGKDAIGQVEDVIRTYKGDVRGQALTMKVFYEHEEPGFFGKLFGKEAKTKSYQFTKSPMRGMMQQSLYDGANAYVEQGGTVDTLSGEKLDAQRNAAELFHRRNYLENGYELEIIGADDVDGEKAVVMEVTSPSGESREEYYSLESGLLLKVVNEQKMRGNTVKRTQRLMDYESFNPGIKFPNKIKTDIGGRITIEFEREKIRINQGIDDAKFSLE